MKQRIIGIDVARALAVIGMIIVNFKVVIGDKGDGLIKTISGVFDGKAAATFVVLAGVGLALMTNSAIKNRDAIKLNIAKKRIIKRALFLFVVGLSYIAIWPADILHFYGIYMIAVLLLLTKSDRTILIASLILILGYPLLLMIWDYEIGWNFDTLSYEGFWTIEGFVKNLFYNGFHPVIPWAAFMLVGYWFGKQDLRNNAYVKKIFIRSLIVFIAIQLISIGSISFLADGDLQAANELTEILGTNPMPPLPIYMFSGISIALTIICGCILLGQRFKTNKLIDALNKTGQLALTFYVAHVVIGMGIIDAVNPSKLGEYSIEFSVLYALGFSLLCILFAIIWRRYKTSGPLEWLMRKITD